MYTIAKLKFSGIFLVHKHWINSNVNPLWNFTSVSLSVALLCFLSWSSNLYLIWYQEHQSCLPKRLLMVFLFTNIHVCIVILLAHLSTFDNFKSVSIFQCSQLLFTCTGCKSNMFQAFPFPHRFFYSFQHHHHFVFHS